MEFQAGDRVLGRYQVEARIGGGVASRVYRALRLSSGQAVAVKVLHNIPVGSHAAARFVREARLLTTVRHPAVVELLDFGQLPDDALCIVTEFVNGHALDELLLDLGPIPWPEVLRLALSILSGLEAIHRAGVLHRNLTPANVMVLPDPPVRVKILDLGFAKGSGDESEAPLTSAGETVGSPAYMAPEQVFGGKLTGRADLYSTALILWELLTGKQPFRSATMAHLVTRAKEPLPAPTAPASCPPVHAALAAVLRKAASPEPGDRFPTARAFADALREARRIAQRGSHREASGSSRAPLSAASQPVLRQASGPAGRAAAPPPPPPSQAPPRPRRSRFAADANTEPDLPAIQRDAQGRGVAPSRPEPRLDRPHSDWRQHAAPPPAPPSGRETIAFSGAPPPPAAPNPGDPGPEGDPGAAETMAYFGEPSAVVTVPAGPPAAPVQTESFDRAGWGDVPHARSARGPDDVGSAPTEPAMPARGGAAPPGLGGHPEGPRPKPEPAPGEPTIEEPSVHVALAVRAARLSKRTFQRRLREALGAWGDAHPFNEDTWFLFLHATSEAAARNRVGVLVRRFQQQLGDDTRGAWAAVAPEATAVPEGGFGEVDQLPEDLRKLLAQVGL